MWPWANYTHPPLTQDQQALCCLEAPTLHSPSPSPVVLPQGVFTLPRERI